MTRRRECGRAMISAPSTARLSMLGNRLSVLQRNQARRPTRRHWRRAAFPPSPRRFVIGRNFIMPKLITSNILQKTRMVIVVLEGLALRARQGFRSNRIGTQLRRLRERDLYQCGLNKKFILLR